VTFDIGGASYTCTAPQCTTNGVQPSFWYLDVPIGGVDLTRGAAGTDLGNHDTAYFDLVNNTAAAIPFTITVDAGPFQGGYTQATLGGIWMGVPNGAFSWYRDGVLMGSLNPPQGHIGDPYDEITVPISPVGGYSLSMTASGVIEPGQELDYTEFATLSTPEASTWTLLIAGFVGLGYAGYRRARKVSAVAVAA
jgi:hypothetical protein